MLLVVNQPVHAGGEAAQSCRFSCVIIPAGSLNPEGHDIVRVLTVFAHVQPELSIVTVFHVPDGQLYYDCIVCVPVKRLPQALQDAHDTVCIGFDAAVQLHGSPHVDSWTHEPLSQR